MTTKQANLIRSLLQQQIGECMDMAHDAADDLPVLAECHMASADYYQETMAAFDALWNADRETGST